jgi:hypothetical protein
MSNDLTEFSEKFISGKKDIDQAANLNQSNSSGITGRSRGRKNVIHSFNLFFYISEEKINHG